jgi:hypothetical protein
VTDGRPAELRADQQRLAADPVGQHAGEKSDGQVGGYPCGLDEPDVGGGPPRSATTSTPNATLLM